MSFTHTPAATRTLASALKKYAAEDELKDLRAAINKEAADKPVVKKDIFGKGPSQTLRCDDGTALVKLAADPVEPESGEDAPSPDGPAAPEPGTDTPTSFLNKEVAQLLARQIGNEVFSAYAYYAVAGWFHNQGLDGFQKFFAKQADGEMGHFRKIYDYLLEAGQEFTMPAIDAPQRDYSSVEAACAAVVKLEKTVTADWREIHRAAMADQDAATTGLSIDFLQEQMEEESLVLTLMQRVKTASKDGILTIDASLME